MDIDRLKRLLNEDDELIGLIGDRLKKIYWTPRVESDGWQTIPGSEWRIIKMPATYEFVYPKIMKGGE